MSKFNLGAAIVNLFSAGAAATKVGKIVASVINFVALSGVAAALTPKPLNNVNPVKRNLQSRKFNSRGPISPRQYVYGEVPVGGQIAFLHTTGDDNEHLHIVLVHATHECEELGDLFINNERVQLQSAADGALRES